MTDTKYAREKLSSHLRNKYPNRIPVIIVPSPEIEIKEVKYLVPYDMTLLNFMNDIKQKIEHNENKTFYFLFNEKLYPVFWNIRDVYEKEKSDDGFVYAFVVCENFFGHPFGH